MVVLLAVLSSLTLSADAVAAPTPTTETPPATETAPTTEPAPPTQTAPPAETASSAAPAPSAAAKNSAAERSAKKLATGAAATPAAARRIAVAPFRADGLDDNLGLLLSDLVAVELAKFEGTEVLSHSDLRALIDRAALVQLLGCDDPACFVDVNAAVPARRLVAGSVGKVDNTLVVAASLLDLTEGRVVARASVPVAGGVDDVRAAVRAIALALVLGNSAGLPAELVVQGEVDAALLERARIASRVRGPSARVLGGAVLSMPFAFGAPVDPPYPGPAGFVELTIPLSEWFGAVVGVGASVSRGRFVNSSTFTFADVDTSGAFVADFSVGGGHALLGLQLQPPTGLVRPRLLAAATGDLLVLDVSDLTYVPDDGAADLPPPLDEPLPFRQSVAGGGGLVGGVGVDWNVLDHVAVCVDLRAHGKLHGLEKVFLNAGRERRQPFAPLIGSSLFVGVSYDF